MRGNARLFGHPSPGASILLFIVHHHEEAKGASMGRLLCDKKEEESCANSVAAGSDYVRHLMKFPTRLFCCSGRQELCLHQPKMPSLLHRRLLASFLKMTSQIH
jgi:hypothetical protein